MRRRRAAGYVDRILKSEKAADLLVQAPTKYETVIKGGAGPDRATRFAPDPKRGLWFTACSAMDEASS
jgi:hypothetical protein